MEGWQTSRLVWDQIKDLICSWGKDDLNLTAQNLQFLIRVMLYNPIPDSGFDWVTVFTFLPVQVSSETAVILFMAVLTKEEKICLSSTFSLWDFSCILVCLWYSIFSSCVVVRAVRNLMDKASFVVRPQKVVRDKCLTLVISVPDHTTVSTPSLPCTFTVLLLNALACFRQLSQLNSRIAIMSLYHSSCLS